MADQFKGLIKRVDAAPEQVDVDRAAPGAMLFEARAVREAPGRVPLSDAERRLPASGEELFAALSEDIQSSRARAKESFAGEQPEVRWRAPRGPVPADVASINWQDGVYLPTSVPEVQALI